MRSLSRQRGPLGRRVSRVVLAVSGLALSGAAMTAGDSVITGGDVLWLNRVTYGAGPATAASYLRLGRQRFLDQQLRARDEALPDEVAEQIKRLAISDDGANTPEARLAAVHAENHRINTLAREDDKQT